MRERVEKVEVLGWNKFNDLKMDYNLKGKTNNGHLYEDPQMVMYSLPQALTPAEKKLVYHLAPYGYHPVNCTSENFKHDNKPIKFNLVVEYLE